VAQPSVLVSPLVAQSKLQCTHDTMMPLMASTTNRGCRVPTSLPKGIARRGERACLSHSRPRRSAPYPRKWIDRPRRRGGRGPLRARQFGFFEHGIGANDDDHAAFGDGVAGAVGIGIEADDGAFGQVDVAVNDGAADAAAANERILHPRKPSDPYKAKGSATHAVYSKSIIYAWYSILRRAFDCGG
jgi:hypothetical protein